ncbi:ABC transporter substrate-binding protein [Spongiactinospora rosea]|uniref:ABC transporter substrate-binding protein n=1 Tax=Spongiactinospora rosea TaxID=2248750 RepID=A0A366M1S4_9ACTN|nr:ABC transporter substrate-binding protein [Spongiactinospora rosea]RBQ20135.1 ABC transporter substrate-binding protein [Spongiactinospora rosea]
MSNPVLHRRGFLTAVAGSAALMGLAACGGSGGGAAASPAASGGGWAFTDDRGKKVSLSARPTRVVAQAAAAAALWDFGVRPIAVFGPHRLKDGGRDPQVGEVDITKVESLGNVFDEFNVEKYASLRPELLVSGMYDKNELWYVPEKSAAAIESVAPTVGVMLSGPPLDKVIGRYAELAAALGADLNAPAVLAAKARFDAASAKLTELAGEKKLKVLIMSGGPDSMWVVVPADHAGVTYMRSVGVDVVVPEKPDSAGFFETLSWENADKYAADVILYDDRARSMTIAEMKQKPTFAKLPAVAAGQTYPWRAEERFSYLGHAGVLEELIAALDKSKKLV